MLRENKSFKINFTIELFQMFGYTGKDAVVLKDAKNEKLRFFHIMNKGAKISDDETGF